MKKFLLIVLSMLTLPIFSQEIKYKDLLEIRLKNDSLYTQINNSYQIAKNNYKSTKIQAYIRADLSTGNINLTINSDKTKKGLSLEPSASINSPMLNNIGIQFSFPYSNYGESNLINKGFSTSVFFDIYSQNRKKSKLEIENAVYALSVLEKQIKMKESLIEKKLLTEIKMIFNEYIALLESRMQLTIEDIKYRQTVIQGYKKDSPKLRIATLSFMRTKRNTKEAEFSFLRNFATFTKDCNIEVNSENIDNFFITLAKSITTKDLVNSEDLKEENFIAIINAEREYKNLIKQNKMNRSIFSAQANAGYSLRNEKKGTVNSKSQSIQTGITMNLPGCKFYSGLNFPLEEGKKINPNLNFSFSFNPIQLYNHILMIKNIKLNEEQEKLKLEEQKTKIKKTLYQFKIQLDKIKWQQELYSEELLIYEQNVIQQRKWFKQGLISVLEKKQAELEYQQALLRTAQSNIDAIIFRIQINEEFNTANSK